jgi:hypothetical protein
LTDTSKPRNRKFTTTTTELWRTLAHIRTESAQIKNFIDGRFVEVIGGRYLDNLEPATGKPSSQVADSSLNATLLGRTL